jgi:general secretion pathway protein J
MARRATSRGMTLLEILVSITILAVIGLLIYGAFDSMSRGRKGEALRTERAHQGREAILRMTRELQAAFLSLHNPQLPALITRTTAFIGKSGAGYDRIDFVAFAHRRIERDAKESDQCEVGYSAQKDPDVDDKFDLLRREQTPVDMIPNKGGIVNVMAENVLELRFRYMEPLTAQWLENWDTTSLSGQPGRLPLEVKIVLVLKGLPNGDSYPFTTKVWIPIQQPLSFAIPK